MKKILITGGNSGIGYATAKLFKENGYDVTICGRNPERVNQAATEIQVEGIVADMTNLGDIEALSSRFTESGLDALVNNAATAKFMPINLHTEMDYNEFFNTNIRGPMALIQALLPALEKCQGCVTNISSAITKNGLPNASLYAATKGAIESTTRSLALELAPKNIRVNAVSPGAIDTPIINKLGIPPEQIEAAKAQQEAMIPLRRYGLPDEVAQVILAQIEATYVTGSIWGVDGGVDAH
jgi:NAD(P)-dependent dehydrogenase (short-subunit alcohol dehydrogenase family)